MERDHALKIGKTIALLFISLVVLSIIGITYIAVTTPAKEAVIRADTQASEVMRDVIQLGISTAVIDLKGDTVIVDFILPQGTILETAELGALRSAALKYPTSTSISMLVLQNNVVIDELNISTDRVRAFEDGSISGAELLSGN